MGNAIYATLTRQSGLMREMQAVANNIANMSTTGFRREGVIFSEYVKSAGDAPSVSMARASPRHVDLSEGDLVSTGATFDMAIRGDGFFLVETSDGPRLTRAGSFMPSAEGELLTPDGNRLLDAGGAPIVIPPDASVVSIASDGTFSAGGLPFARVGLWQPGDTLSLRHDAGTLFSADAPEPLEDGGVILQGYLESANVDPVSEMSRMIAVTRAYEIGQSLLDREDERIRAVIQTLNR